MCQGLEQQSKIIIFESLVSHFRPTLNRASSFLRQLDTVANIGLSLKPNHRNQIYQVKLVQIPDTLCRINQRFRGYYIRSDREEH